MYQRWSLHDIDTSQTMRLVRNPRAMGNLNGKRKTENSRPVRGVVRVLRAPDGAFDWQFEGRVHTRAEYDALASWVSRRRVVVTDHLGREHLVIPTGFEPTPLRQNGTRNPWLYDYVFKALYLGRYDVTRTPGGGA